MALKIRFSQQTSLPQQPIGSKSATLTSNETGSATSHTYFQIASCPTPKSIHPTPALKTLCSLMGVRIVDTTIPWKSSHIFMAQICPKRMSIIKNRASYGLSIKLRSTRRAPYSRITVSCMFPMHASTNLADSTWISMAVLSQSNSIVTSISDLWDISNTQLLTISSCCSHKMQTFTIKMVHIAGLPPLIPTRITHKFKPSEISSNLSSTETSSTKVQTLL